MNQHTICSYRIFYKIRKMSYKIKRKFYEFFRDKYYFLRRPLLSLYYSITYKPVKTNRFGILYVDSTTNLGDYIQTLAQIEALKKFNITSDIFVDRENLSNYDKDPINLVMSGWYMHNHCHFPPSKKINPIFISVHINKEILIKRHHSYLKRYQPIGCRDSNTRNWLKKHGIKAYLSKCLTLIFDCYDGKRKGVYQVDVLVDNINYIPKLSDTFLNSIPENAIPITNESKPIKNCQDGLKQASELLSIYKKAELIITTRLHCVLPCRAMGTPTVFAHAKYNKDNRFKGLYKEINGSDGLLPFNETVVMADNELLKVKADLLKDLKDRLDNIKCNVMKIDKYV